MSRYHFDNIINWRDWNPGLDNDLLTLGEVIDTLPGYPAEDIPFIIRFFENPESKFSFEGSISLERHDCIHAILGRGLLNQDEAFVIGYTMGTSKLIPQWQKNLFKFVSHYLYPNDYRFNEADIKISFRLGFGFGQTCGCHHINQIPIETWKKKTLRDIRQFLSINTEQLRAYYRQELVLRPDTVASQRLDILTDHLDPMNITSPKSKEWIL